jgi:hypothetical protein
MIQKIRIVGGVAVVTAYCGFHPLRKLSELAIELKALGFEGEVLFDLLAVNGLADNRFSSMKFLGNNFDHSSFARESDVNPDIESEQNAIAKQDTTFLLGSVLSSSEIEKFTH